MLTKNEWSAATLFLVLAKFKSDLILGDVLFAIGGFDGKQFLKSIEYLNCNKLNDGWSMFHKQSDFEFLA